jgi:uncharacterized protein (TIGR02118 family)
MFKILAFLTKRADLDDAQFVEYYENRHIPFMMGLAPGPTLYKRRYLKRGTEMEVGNGSVDFDVVTEVGFPDREAFEAWLAEVFKPGNAERVAQDEANFLDRARSRSYVVVDERITAG